MEYCFDNTLAQVSRFDNSTEVKEYHVMIHVTDTLLDFRRQFEALTDTLERLRRDELECATPVFKRYFLSDAANQADFVMGDALDNHDGAVSIIQQPPLDGTKIALWAWLQTGVKARHTQSGLYEVTHGSYRQLITAGAHYREQNSEYQTRLLLNNYIMQLIREGCSLEANCLRTWFFVNDIDNHYGGVVKARNEVFYTQGLTDKTHFIASTGIGGRQGDAKVFAQMDAYAVDGIRKEQVHYLYAPSHLNRTSEYGVSFERGTYIDYGRRRHVFISGTASIDNKGNVLYKGDVKRQTARLWENVECLLQEADAGFDDVREMVVYLRDAADYHTVRALYQERFPDIPTVFVQASVCRPSWLVEMECMAVRENQSEFEEF